MVQCDPDQDHLFLSDKGSAVQSEPWPGGGFTRDFGPDQTEKFESPDQTKQV